jgi:phosphomannomutase
MDEAIFKAYDIRGLYPDQIDEDAAWKIGHAAGQFMRSRLEGFDRGQEAAQTVVVGRDMRTHSPSLAGALKEGVLASGAHVVDIGMVDTPQVYFAINHLGACGGVQVTASHNPAEYNGCKFSGQKAHPIGSDTGLKEIQHIAANLRHHGTAGEGGKERSEDLTDAYRRHVLSFLQGQPKPLKLVIDASNGMAGKMVPLLFGDLGLEIIDLNFEHEGRFKHDPNPLVEANLSAIKPEVISQGADVGICFDGDADRLIVIDERGEAVKCDIFTALLAQYFLDREPGSTVVYDLRSSWAIKEVVTKLGGHVKRERVGHSFMKKAMKDCKAIFGGELSGHFYYRDNFYADSGMITMVHLLNILSDSNQTMSELVGPLLHYYSSGEINFEVEDKEAAMQQFADMHREAEVDYLDGVTVQYSDWWFNCRASNTEPLLRLNVEAVNAELLAEKLGELQELLGEPVAH